MRTALIIGSVAWDEIVDISTPLKPGAHNSGQPGTRRPGGGATNTAIALLRAGIDPIVLSAVGSDPDGQKLIDMLGDLGLDTGKIVIAPGDTTRSLVLIDPEGERTVVNLARATLTPSPDWDHLHPDLVYIRSADPRLTPYLTYWAPRATIIAHLPPSKDIRRPSHILLGSRSDLDNEFLACPFAAGKKIAGEALQWVIITDGERGATAYGPEEQLVIPTPSTQVVDSTGAGDAFAAGLISALLEGSQFRAALDQASLWGAASVTYAGTIPPADFPPRCRQAPPPT